MISLKLLRPNAGGAGTPGGIVVSRFPEPSLSCFDIGGICLIQAQSSRFVVAPSSAANGSHRISEVSSVHHRGDDVCRTASN